MEPPEYTRIALLKHPSVHNSGAKVFVDERNYASILHRLRQQLTNLL